MTAKELRQAAERILTSCSTRFGEGVFSLASHILATVQEDGEEPVTEDWLRDKWGFEEWEPSMLMRDKICACKCPSDSASQMSIWLWSKNGISDMRRITRVTTRSQFRALCQGLGIEPQKIS